MKSAVVDGRDLAKIGKYLRPAGVFITLAAFPVDDGSFVLYGSIVMIMGSALRFGATRV